MKNNPGLALCHENGAIWVVYRNNYDKPNRMYIDSDFYKWFAKNAAEERFTKRNVSVPVVTKEKNPKLYEETLRLMKKMWDIKHSTKNDRVNERLEYEVRLDRPLMKSRKTKIEVTTKEGLIANIPYDILAMYMETPKSFCAHCKGWKNLDEFTVVGIDKKTGKINHNPRSYCKECDREWTRKRKERKLQKLSNHGVIKQCR